MLYKGRKCENNKGMSNKEMRTIMINSKNNIKNNIKILDIFLFISGGISFLFLVGNAMNGGKFFDELVMDSTFLFSDFFYHIAGSSNTAIMYSYGDPYSFPPFCYLMYTVLWSLNPYKDSESILYWKNYRDYDNMLVVFVMYNIICIILFLYCLKQYFKKSGFKYDVLLPMVLVISYPFMCTSIQRGNVCLLVAILFSIAWLWKDEESIWKQEIALILFACCAGFKLYPAIFGLVYVKRKHWKKVGRLIVYGIITVFAPFLIIGGPEGAKNLLKTLTGFATYIDPGRTNTVCGMGKWLGLKLNMTEVMAENLGVGINYIFFLGMILMFFFAKKKWHEALFLTAILVHFIPSNYEYTSSYYLLVLLLFLKENEGRIADKCLREKVYLICHSILFALLFSADFLMIYYRYGLISGMFTVMYVMIAINIVCVLKNEICNYVCRDKW